MNIQIENNKYKLIKVKDDDFEVILCSLGASIYAIKNKQDYLTLTPATLDNFFTTKFYHGKTVGRFANRLKGDVIVLNNKKYFLDANEKGNTLHGGNQGISSKEFDYQIKENENDTQVIFHYYSKEGESGFFGDLDISVTYSIYAKLKKLRIDFSAYSNNESICALTNHTYFSIGEESLANVNLYINSDKYLYTNPNDLLPIKEEKVNKCLDFSKGKIITKDINDPSINIGRLSGYDHHFIYKEIDTNKPQIILKGNKYRLAIYTDFSGNQIYTDNKEGKGSYFNTNAPKYRGIAIEPQDSFLNVNTIKKGDIYKRFITYEFSPLK